MVEELDLTWLQEQADDNETRCRILQIAEWRKRALQRNELPQDRTVIVLRLGGYELCVEVGAAFCALEVYQEIFRDNEHFLVPGFDARDARVVVDLGANHGFYVLKVKERSPECCVLCAEPNPYVFPLLQKNMVVNGITNVVLVNKAVTAHEGRTQFDLIRQIHSISGRGLREVPRGWMKEEFIETVEVETVTLAGLLASQRISAVDILKVDVEGMEVEVLRSAAETLGYVRRIVVERHSRALREAILSFLIGRGFDLVREQDPDCQQYYGDMYFVNRMLMS